MTDTRQHAMLSPSGAYRWMSCAGSIALESEYPESHNKHSDEGTAAHAVAAMCLTEGRPATAYIGRRVEIGPFRTYEFREDMAEPVQAYVDMVLSYAAASGPSVAETMHELHVEVRVPVGHVTGEEGAEGTSDAVVITSDQEEIQVHDLKFGRGVRVGAERNPQMMLYALGALEKFDVLGSFKRVRLVIHQPRLDSVSEWDCTIEDLLAFADEVREKAKLALWIYTDYVAKRTTPPEQWKTLTPSSEACKFCKAKATCPAIARKVEETVGASFELLTADDGTPHSVAPGLLDSDALADKMKACDLIETWIKGVRAEVERRLLAGCAVPEFKIVKGRQGNRSYTSVDEAETLLKSFRLKHDEMYKSTLKGPADIEKVLKEQPKRWKKVEALITRSDGALSVAHVSDKRPAVECKPAADAFEELTGAEDLV